MDRDHPPRDDPREDVVTIRPVRAEDLSILFEHQRTGETGDDGHVIFRLV